MKDYSDRRCRECAFCVPERQYCIYQDRPVGTYFMNNYSCKYHTTEEELSAQLNNNHQNMFGCAEIDE